MLACKTMAADMQPPAVSSAVQSLIALLTEAMQYVNLNKAGCLVQSTSSLMRSKHVQELQGAHEWIGFLQYSFR